MTNKTIKEFRKEFVDDITNAGAVYSQDVARWTKFKNIYNLPVIVENFILKALSQQKEELQKERIVAIEKKMLKDKTFIDELVEIQCEVKLKKRKKDFKKMIEGMRKNQTKEEAWADSSYNHAVDDILKEIQGL